MKEQGRRETEGRQDPGGTAEPPESKGAEPIWWDRPPADTRKDIVGIRQLPDGRTEYLLHNEAFCHPYYLATSAGPSIRGTLDTATQAGEPEHGTAVESGYEHPVDELAQRVIQDHPPTILSAAYREVARRLYDTINPRRQAASPDSEYEWLRKHDQADKKIKAQQEMLERAKGLIDEFTAVADGELGSDWADDYGPLYEMLSAWLSDYAKLLGNNTGKER